LEKVLGRSAEEKYILESRPIQFRKTQIIFVMLSIFLTGNFSHPSISTGIHFINFHLEKHGFKEQTKPESRNRMEKRE